MAHSKKKPAATGTRRKGPKPVDKELAKNIPAVLGLRPKGVKKGAKAVAKPGICEQCIHTEYCTYPKTDERPVMLCGEFEGHSLTEATKVSGIKDTRPVVTPSKAKQTAEPLTILRGLCRTCEKRETCEYPKPESGVWRCEEYE